MTPMKLNPEWVSAQYEERIINQRTFKKPKQIISIGKQVSDRLKANAIIESIMQTRSIEQVILGPRRWNTLESYAAGEPPIPQYIPV